VPDVDPFGPQTGELKAAAFIISDLPKITGAKAEALAGDQGGRDLAPGLAVLCDDPLLPAQGRHFSNGQYNVGGIQAQAHNVDYQVSLQFVPRTQGIYPPPRFWGN
jgi:hypothetical protein